MLTGTNQQSQLLRENRCPKEKRRDKPNKGCGCGLMPVAKQTSAANTTRSAIPHNESLLTKHSDVSVTPPGDSRGARTDVR